MSTRFFLPKPGVKNNQRVKINKSPRVLPTLLNTRALPFILSAHLVSSHSPTLKMSDVDFSFGVYGKCIIKGIVSVK